MMLKRQIKRMVFLGFLILLLPFIVITWVEKHVTQSEVFFVGLGQLFSLVPGPIGKYVRGAYYFGTLDECSWEVHIGFGSLFTHRGARIADRVSMGSYCVIGHASIGRDVRMASRISIPSGKRQHLDESGELSPGTQYDQVKIESDCWLGEGAIILDNVAQGSIVSAGAVVTKAMPASSIIGGNPARVLKTLHSSSTLTPES